MKLLTPQDVKAKLDADEPIHLIDIRPVDKYEHAHIPGAINVPGDGIDHIREILHDKSATVIVYGDNETQDQDIASTCSSANEAGCENAYGLEGGLMVWMEQGYPVDHGEES